MRWVPVRARTHPRTHHTAVAPDDRYVVAVHSGAGGISVIDLCKIAVIEIAGTGALPKFAVFSPNGKRPVAARLIKISLVRNNGMRP